MGTQPSLEKVEHEEPQIRPKKGLLAFVTLPALIRGKVSSATKDSTTHITTLDPATVQAPFDDVVTTSLETMQPKVKKEENKDKEERKFSNAELWEIYNDFCHIARIGESVYELPHKKNIIEIARNRRDLLSDDDYKSALKALQKFQPLLKKTPDSAVLHLVNRQLELFNKKDDVDETQSVTRKALGRVASLLLSRNS